MKQPPSARLQIGTFEVDWRSGDLHDGDRKTILQQQPLQVLRLLAEAGGELVTREEIRKKLWPNDTIVEFDHSINAAIVSLRRALGDPAKEPKYIGTVARRGYRLLVPVTWIAADDSGGEVPVSRGGAAVRLQPAPTLLGKKVSHYRVLEIIGGGGMGLIYKAEDLKLGRQVALKFLPEELSEDAVALQRFEREARTASSLDHPNICTIHGVEEHGGEPFIVMQLLQGETLRDRLAAVRALNRTIPLDELLDIAIPICSGLEAAHAKGIIHRDIKPGNIFLTSSGQVKILDFGLAKAVEAPAMIKAQPMVQAPHFSPAKRDADMEGNGFGRPDRGGLYESRPQEEHGTRNDGTPDGVPVQDRVPDATLTGVGTALGTAGYMSPEQIRGEKLDARTDIFSFGLVLYEMATGQRAFGGETQAVLHDAILVADPVPAQDLNPTLPARFCEILGKALQKDREQRCQSAVELRAAFEEVKQCSRPEAPRKFPKHWLVLAAASLLLAVLAGGIYWRSSQLRLSSADKLTSKHWIVLADFSNSTGDPVFDGTLRQALAMQLEQSPFLNVLSDRQVGDTLKLMGRQPNEKLTPEIARQLCVRSNSKAFLVGSIARTGQQFVISEEAINCQTGENIASAEAPAQNRKAVLPALQDVGDQLRQKLGESLGSIATLSQPLEKATTSSLEALQEYALGLRIMRDNSVYESIQYFQQAIALDPNFTLAYLRLGVANANFGNASLARSNLSKAYELRDRVSQRERLHIEAAYYESVLGDLQQGILTFRKIVQMYPNDYQAQGALGSAYYGLGDYESAVTQYQRSLRLFADNPAVYNMLGKTYTALNRWQDAAAAFQKEEALTPDQVGLRQNLYYLAFAQGDEAAMQEQVARAVGMPDEDFLLYVHSVGEAYHGRLANSRELLQQAIDLAQQKKRFDAAARWQEGAAVIDAEVGDTAEALRKAKEALQMGTSNLDVNLQASAAVINARVGDPAKARELTETLSREFPRHTLLQHYYLPTIAAALEMRRGDPRKALELLEPASTYERCQCGWRVPDYYAAYLRGLAYLKLGQGQNAALQFQKILDHPGIVVQGITGALAHLQLGRAYAMAGETAKAKAAYQDFLNLWKDADPDIPIYKKAKTEYAKLI